MSKRETRLLALACTFIGIAVGFLISPIKKGMYVTCGNNNTFFQPDKKNREEKKRLNPVPVSEKTGSCAQVRERRV